MLFRLLLVAACFITPVTVLGQMQVFARFEGRLLPVVETLDGSVWVLEKGKHRRASRGIELRAATEFSAQGTIRIGNIAVDLDPLRDAPVKKKADPASIRFRYSAEITPDFSAKHAFGVLTLLAKGSIVTHLVDLGGLRAGATDTVRIELPSSMESVGRLHVFVESMEVRTSQTTGPYDAREYMEQLRTASSGIPATELCRFEQQYPHVLSDDGTLLASLRQRDTHWSLIVFDLARMDLLQDVKLGSKGQRAYNLTWVSDHELAYIGFTDAEPWKACLMLLDVATGTPEKLAPSVNAILTSLPKQPHVLVVVRDSGSAQAGTWKYDIRQRKYFDQDRLQEGWTYFDDNGEERIRRFIDGRRMRYFYKPVVGKGWKPLDGNVIEPGLTFDLEAGTMLDRKVEIHSLGPDGDTLYISTRTDSDCFELAAMSLAEGRITRRIAKHPKYDFADLYSADSTLLFRKRSSELIGFVYEAEKRRVVWFDPYFKQVQAMMEKSCPDHVCDPLDWSKDGDTFIYFAYSDRDPGTYYMLRPRESLLAPLQVNGEHLKDKPMGRTIPMDFASRDGQQIHAYVTRPPGEPRGPSPLVAYIHGGPTVRDSWRYDALVQFLATRGYVVLQVNYRGSSGYGKKYQNDGLYARLDTVILDDIADGVKHLIGTGEVDPTRVAAIGASFGGWATYMSLIKYPEIYRAGVAIAAVSHWKRAIRDDVDRFDNKYGAVFWRELLERSDFSESERFIDPLRRAAELKQPIYIMHGEWDDVVHPTQSKLMLEALRKANPHVESMSFVTASHSTWPYDARVKQLNEIEGFLRRHLAPPADTAEADLAAVSSTDSTP